MRDVYGITVDDRHLRAHKKAKKLLDNYQKACGQYDRRRYDGSLGGES